MSKKTQILIFCLVLVGVILLCIGFAVEPAFTVPLAVGLIVVLLLIKLGCVIWEVIRMFPLPPLAEIFRG